jgi:predicted RNA-binding protein with EMAP domain
MFSQVKHHPFYVNMSSRSSKLMATDRHAQLRAEVFEELQVLKVAWCATIADLAQQNSEEIKEVLDEFEDMFLADEGIRQWDEEISSHWD